MATTELDNDEKVRIEAQAALNILREKYWDAKTATPPPRFDDLFDLRRAYENAVIEYAGLEGRLLRDDILSTDIDLKELQKIRSQMSDAKEMKELLNVALNFIKTMSTLA